MNDINLMDTFPPHTQALTLKKQKPGSEHSSDTSSSTSDSNTYYEDDFSSSDDSSADEGDTLSLNQPA